MILFICGDFLITNIQGKNLVNKTIDFIYNVK